MPRLIASCICLVAVAGCATKPKTVRFATFNASLNRNEEGKLVKDLSTPDNQQAKNVAEIIQRVRPDVLLINEFDWSEDGTPPQLFQKNYLSISQNGSEPIEYPFRVFLPVNTGIPSGCDLDNDGMVIMDPGTRGYGNDCFGFGQFPGQYGMLLLSRYPFADIGPMRTFQKFLWKDMPGAMLPTKEDGSPWYSDDELAVLPLSSKSHWDVGLKIGTATVHVLASHPTPPAFDGPEDRNGKRNHDEIRLWRDYLDQSRFLVDDGGAPLPMWIVPPSIVLMGDMNADPSDGGSIPGAIQQLLDHPRVNSSFTPSSDGAVDASTLQGGKNTSQKGDPRFDTADFSDRENGPGNLRCDYVLPSNDLTVLGGGVFWPATPDPLHRLVEMNPVASSDHRMVWLDVAVPQK